MVDVYRITVERVFPVLAFWSLLYITYYQQNTVIVVPRKLW